MSKTAQDSQEKKVVGASFANIVNGIFSLKLKFSDDSKCSVGISAADIENLIGQAETAIADEQLFFIAPNERRFVCELYALREIKTLFTKSRGDSDAHVVGSRANAQSKGRKNQAKASAAVCPQRQFNNPKSGRRVNVGSKSPAAAAVPISSGVRDSRRKSRAVRCDPREASVSRVKTKNGRTSVVVATRKVS